MRTSIANLRRALQECEAAKRAERREEIRFAAFAACILVALVLAVASGVTWESFT